MENNYEQPLDMGFEAEESPQGELRFRITSEIRRYWKETARWGMFFSIIGLLYIGIALLTFFLSISLLGIHESTLSTFFILVALAIIVPLWWLMFRFSRYTQKAVLHDDPAAAHVGFTNLRRLFQLLGILLIILLVFYGIVILISLIAVLG